MLKKLAMNFLMIYIASLRPKLQTIIFYSLARKNIDYTVEHTDGPVLPWAPSAPFIPFSPLDPCVPGVPADPGRPVAPWTRSHDV